ncbi:hypothetical protein AMECASPLE_006671 [Ameca splendens]|uniref:Transmembrane protein n=1 Tax=Ameca splendens TaxID=208324 RepID=A0ABV0YAN2_9TELE
MKMVSARTKGSASSLPDREKGMEREGERARGRNRRVNGSSLIHRYFQRRLNALTAQERLFQPTLFFFLLFSRGFRVDFLRSFLKQQKQHMPPCREEPRL